MEGGAGGGQEGEGGGGGGGPGEKSARKQSSSHSLPILYSSLPFTPLPAKQPLVSSGS